MMFIVRSISLFLAAIAVGALPAFAQSLTFAGFVQKIETFVNTAVIPLLYVLAFLFFLIGVVRYFFTGGAENREIGRTYVIWALVGMVAIFGIWGIVKLLLNIIPAT